MITVEINKGRHIFKHKKTMLKVMIQSKACHIVKIWRVCVCLCRKHLMWCWRRMLSCFRTMIVMKVCCVFNDATFKMFWGREKLFFMALYNVVTSQFCLCVCFLDWRLLRGPCCGDCQALWYTLPAKDCGRWQIWSKRCRNQDLERYGWRAGVRGKILNSYINNKCEFLSLDDVLF